MPSFIKYIEADHHARLRGDGQFARSPSPPCFIAEQKELTAVVPRDSVIVKILFIVHACMYLSQYKGALL